MRFIVDHDFHIHSFLSLCSNDPDQNPEAILAYAEKYGLKTICLTNHMWDASVKKAGVEFYDIQSYEHIKKALPLPQSENVRFLFGCEADMDKDFVIGVSPKTAEELDFIIISTTHMHLNGFTVKGTEDAAERAELWIKRFDKVLDSDLPFHKTGFGHMTCPWIWDRNRYYLVLEKIPIDEYHRLFEKAAKKGIGIELNFPAGFDDPGIAETVLTPYRIAREEGCKFYLGGDAHNPRALELGRINFDAMIDLLGLTEDDKFRL